MAEPTDYTIHERVCNVLEWLAMHEPEDLAVFASQVYRFTHHANAPECRILIGGRNSRRWKRRFGRRAVRSGERNMADVSAERLAAIRRYGEEFNAGEVQSKGLLAVMDYAVVDLLAMINARDREIVALREVVQSLQQEGSGRLRYD